MPLRNEIIDKIKTTNTAKLDLSSFNLTDSDMADLLVCLKGKRIHYLDLSKNYLQASVGELSALNIEHINLSNNNLIGSEEGLKLLLGNPKIKQLDLTGNHLQTKGCKLISEETRQQKLFLTWDLISSPFKETIKERLKRNAEAPKQNTKKIESKIEKKFDASTETKAEHKSDVGKIKRAKHSVTFHATVESKVDVPKTNEEIAMAIMALKKLLNTVKSEKEDELLAGLDRYLGISLTTTHVLPLKQ